eukprot:5739266-Amphidinium_carterae.1
MVGRYNLGGPDNVLESLLPWILQPACFAINSDAGADNATQQFAALVNWSWLTIKPITVNKLDIRNKEKKTEGIWLGKTTKSGEHIIATMDESGKTFYTRSLTRLTPELQWDKK